MPASRALLLAPCACSAWPLGLRAHVRRGLRRCARRFGLAFGALRLEDLSVGGLLRTRNFALLWIGQSTSAVGSSITTVALPLVAVSTLHAGPGMVALLTASTWLPWLLI